MLEKYVQLDMDKKDREFLLCLVINLDDTIYPRVPMKVHID